MEVSALKYPAGLSRHGRSPLLRLQSDEHLIRLIRAGHDMAFEVLVSRYEVRLLAFCRHLLGSREDAEDVLQESFSSAYHAIHQDDRPINARPWLYRIARNRCLNHLRRTQAIGLDSMDIMLAENGESTADKVYRREEFRLLVSDISELPETQRTALILREMDALSYDQIAETMETTVPSVKSLLVRARVSLAEASEARLLSCDEVRAELGEVAEGLVRRPNQLVRRHLRKCERCSTFDKQLKRTNRALAALLPISPLALWKTAGLTHLGRRGATAASSSAGHGAAAGATAAAAGSGATAVTSASGFVSAGIGALATKTAAGLAAAVVLTAGAVVADNHSQLAAHDRTSPRTALRHSAATTGRAGHRQRTAAAHTAASAAPLRAQRAHAETPASSHTITRETSSATGALARAPISPPNGTSSAGSSSAAAGGAATNSTAAGSPRPGTRPTPVKTTVKSTVKSTSGGTGAKLPVTTLPAALPSLPGTSDASGTLALPASGSNGQAPDSSGALSGDASSALTTIVGATTTTG